MKVLSIQQPYAELIVSGIKDVENRSWPTKFRGEFLIHASKHFDNESFKYLSIYGSHFEGMTKSDFLLGGIVGKSTLIDCVTKENINQYNHGWFTGKYGFVLKDSCRVEFIPLKGRLGFFEVDLVFKNKRC
ncbi:ASCH domain-containing protein [Leptospira bandrabouensis]|uniref:ASCH domain-containing protein n=1 Tax=Leptospira bandrabouensis TaxID=2484903 RepID=UPI00223E30D5|nr:ASCH domain-containing protein [Leptospira bandrabouensis]MCW7459585.1 ASCH domain-containing protein [Leptospira bandrabouensis]MCW7478397.1 ASCH domain-containing protein [Leptospira bandrabouensis]MCW7486320.1 ASCH domain-containing protein [Leptospira bandrabouensis]